MRAAWFESFASARGVLQVGEKDTSEAGTGEALSAGTLQHRIAHTLSLDEVAKGNELIEQGATRSAVVLTIDPELR